MLDCLNMDIWNLPTIFVVIVFVIGYICIIFEHAIYVNKSASAILSAILAWAIIFATSPVFSQGEARHLEEILASISQVVFFVMGALIIVETINEHRGFNIITKYLHFKKKRVLLWATGIFSFFLSAVLDNLTTTIVMVTLLQKLESRRLDRWVLGSSIVIAANAGGAWTPIGDVTTTMLWIGGQLTTLNIVKSLFVPSLVCFILSTILLTFQVRGKIDQARVKESDHTVEPHGLVVLIFGFVLLIAIPIFKVFLGLPPFMGLLLGLSLLWFYTDFVHRHKRERLRMHSIIRKIDLATVLFFVGILLSVGALEEVGVLRQFALYLDRQIHNPIWIATLIGILSAIVDNVPLVAAAMGMFKLDFYPVDSPFWSAVAYAAGTGGSILVIGSAAGVVFMGLEEVDFFWYIRRISFAALVGFAGGMIVYAFI